MEITISEIDGGLSLAYGDLVSDLKFNQVLTNYRKTMMAIHS